MGESKKILYTAKAQTTGGREGDSRTEDGRLSVHLSPPGANGGGTNPEQLFAVGWSACYMSAVQFVAKKKRVPFPADARDDIEIDLVLTGDAYTLQARHTVRLPGVDPTLARQIVAEAHLVCPYSKATKGNIDVVTNVITSQEVPKLDPLARRMS
jgi:osmotically inducible protein OsmC